MGISAAQVKELREATGVGMMDCKKALTETDGNLEKAIVWLREKGLSKAAKKAGRTAAEGVVVFALNDNKTKAAIVELNCETDFAGKNEDFRAFADKAVQIALKECTSSVEQLNACTIDGKSVQETLAELIGKVGENMVLRRVQLLEGDYVAGYSHMGGKIGTLVCFSGSQSEKLQEVGADLAMHVAASAPKYFDSASVDPAELEQEQAIAKKKLLDQGKPENMLDKIIGGQIKRFYKDVCLVDQPFVKEPKISVSQYVSQSGCGGEATGFIRFQLGEGIEVKKENFADEVAAQIKN